MQPATALFTVEGVRVRRQGLALGARQAAVPLVMMHAGLAVPAVALPIGLRRAFVFSPAVLGHGELRGVASEAGAQDGGDLELASLAALLPQRPLHHPLDPGDVDHQQL